MSIQLRVLDKQGNQAGVLGDVESLSLSPVICDAGAIEFSYPRGGANWEKISTRDEFELQIYVDGEHVPELDGLIKDVDGDDVEEAAVWKFTGFFGNGRLAEAVTYPDGWPSNVDPEFPNLHFTSQTAGAIMRTLLQQAQARGTLTDIDFSSFSSTVDSNGTPWNATISIEYAPQVTYLEIFHNLYAEQDMVEFQMRGHSLFAYVAGSMTVDRTLDDPPLVFRRGRDLSDSPRKKSTRGIATAILGSGAEGLYREVKDDAAIAGRRRIEAAAKQGQISDPGTLLAYTGVELARSVQAKMEKTHGLSFADPNSPRPIKHFWVGDWAWSDMGSGLERLRVKQWVMKLDASGELTGSVTLNDFFAEREELLNKRIQGIIGGSTVTGGSRAVERVPEDLINGVPPSTPLGLAVTSEAYTAANGVTMAQATASWAQVTTNTDGTIYDDAGHYELRFRQPVAYDDWRPLVTSISGLSTSWSSLIPGEVLETQIRAVDKYDNPSPWSVTFSTLTGEDAVGPPQPTAPIGDNYLGLARFQWDGLFTDLAPRPRDFRDTVLYVSPVNNFDPLTEPTAERIGALVGRGSLFVDIPYGESRFGRFISFDVSGNASAVSAISVEIFPDKVVSDDIFAGAVGSLQLADLAVTSAKIALLAVNDAHIGSLSAAKITAGIMNAEVAIGGRFATALQGKRTEFNALGIYRFDEAGVATVAIDDAGALLTGTYRSASSGRRVVIGAASTTTGRMDFYSPDGQNGYVLAYTQSNGVEAMQIGMRPAWAIGDPTWSSLWNRININSSPLGEYTTFKSGTLELVYDAGNTQQASDGRIGVGRFALYETYDRGNTPGGGVKMQVDKGGTSLWAPDFNVFYGTGYGWMNVKRRGGGYSPNITMVNTDGFGAGIQVLRDGRGIWWEVVSIGADSFYGIRAANFEVNSDARDKTQIRTVSDVDVTGFLDKIDQAKLKKWKRPKPKDIDGNEDPLVEMRDELGLVAQDLLTIAPEVVIGTAETGLGIDLYAMISMVWGAIQSLNGRLKDLERKAPK